MAFPVEEIIIGGEGVISMACLRSGKIGRGDFELMGGGGKTLKDTMLLVELCKLTESTLYVLMFFSGFCPVFRELNLMGQLNKAPADQF